MCGLAGIMDLKGARAIDEAALRRMTDALAHRGPDGEGIHVEPGLGLGHRRLAIIDIEGGAQPFHTGSGNGVLAFNGEIYNYRDLRNDPALNGTTFRTRSDTEILAEGLDREGSDFLERVRGMFAFAFWNRSARTLLLARDRLGERPLYFTETRDGFLLFASELGALTASGLVETQYSNSAISDYFLYGYVPDPKTIYQDVWKLKAGEWIEATQGQSLHHQRYWRPDYRGAISRDAASSKETAEALLARLDAAVERQLVADVPLGAFLSGGVDSSAVVASMATAGLQPTACTIGFKNAPFDERPYAAAVADRYGARQVETLVDMDATALIDRIAGVYGEPFADSSALPTYLVCEAARRSVTVALSGDGGDEIFGGYRRYPMIAAEMRTRRFVPPALRRLLFAPAGALYPKLDWAPKILRFKTTLQSLGESNRAGYARAAGLCLPDRIARMMSGDFRQALGGYSSVSVIDDALTGVDLPENDPLAFAQAIDFETWLPGRMLVKVDRAAMAHGLEVRPPLLDSDFVDHAFTLPSALKIKDGQGKAILKEALRPRLSDDILFRKKQGFEAPLKGWLRRPEGPIDRLTTSKAWRDTGLFNTHTVAQMMQGHQSGAADYSQELWSLIMFDAFLKNGAGATNTPR
ncbi:MAG: asparagine synthase (glutamine-hydrolyzing) [Pseudomonadota bacterium]